jgi:hypothetical protein
MQDFHVFSGRQKSMIKPELSPKAIAIALFMGGESNFLAFWIA